MDKIITGAQLAYVWQLKDGDPPEERMFTRIKKSKYNGSKRVPNKKSLRVQSLVQLVITSPSRGQTMHVGGHKIPSIGLSEMLIGLKKTSEQLICRQRMLYTSVNAGVYSRSGKLFYLCFHWQWLIHHQWMFGGSHITALSIFPTCLRSGVIDMPPQCQIMSYQYAHWRQIRSDQ